MKTVTRDEYSSLIQSLPHSASKPVETTDMSCMQWVGRDGELIAQSIYRAGFKPVYQVTDKPTFVS